MQRHKCPGSTSRPPRERLQPRPSLLFSFPALSWSFLSIPASRLAPRGLCQQRQDGSKPQDHSMAQAHGDALPGGGAHSCQALV